MDLVAGRDSIVAERTSIQHSGQARNNMKWAGGRRREGGREEGRHGMGLCPAPHEPLGRQEGQDILGRLSLLPCRLALTSPPHTSASASPGGRKRHAPAWTWAGWEGRTGQGRGQIILATLPACRWGHGANRAIIPGSMLQRRTATCACLTSHCMPLSTLLQPATPHLQGGGGPHAHTLPTHTPPLWTLSPQHLPVLDVWTTWALQRRLLFFCSGAAGA